MGYHAKKQHRWPKGEIVYVFDKDVVLKRKQLIRACMTSWETFVNTRANETVIRFRQGNGSEKYRVLIINNNNISQTNSGSVALTNPGKNGVMKFTVADAHLKSIPHELAHTIGLAHEHERISPLDTTTRPKTGPYLYYHGPNFMAEGYDNLAKKYVPFGDYDVKSITHYPCTRETDPKTNISRLRDNGLRWSDEKYNNSLSEELKLINYPTEEQVLDPKNQTWKPSAGDVAAIIELYSN